MPSCVTCCPRACPQAPVTASLPPYEVRPVQREDEALRGARGKTGAASSVGRPSVRPGPVATPDRPCDARLSRERDSGRIRRVSGSGIGVFCVRGDNRPSPPRDFRDSSCRPAAEAVSRHAIVHRGLTLTFRLVATRRPSSPALERISAAAGPAAPADPLPEADPTRRHSGARLRAGLAGRCRARWRVVREPFGLLSMPEAARAPCGTVS